MQMWWASAAALLPALPIWAAALYLLRGSVGAWLVGQLLWHFGLPHALGIMHGNGSSCGHGQAAATRGSVYLQAAAAAFVHAGPAAVGAVPFVEWRLLAWRGAKLGAALLAACCAAAAAAGLWARGRGLQHLSRKG